MINQNEISRARRRETDAIRSRQAIEALPVEVGQRLRWSHNGVVWIRVGDDEWRADSESRDGISYSSAHIASCPGELVSGVGSEDSANV